ncbi:MAG: hypothetical protein FJ110_13535 [Deltaproteobacteria bacterium]|nr:hypothetical protein [Deltaproteobacteria bacterium]
MSDFGFHISFKRIVLVIITLFLGIFVISTISLWAQPLKKDGKTMKERKKLENSVQKEGRIILIGASYTRGWPIQEIAGMKVINKGVNGNQSFEMLTRFRDDVITNKPRMVLVWGFINDIHRGKREEIQQTIVRAKESIKEMVKLSRTHGIIPILGTELTIRGADNFFDNMKALAGSLLGKESYQGYVNKHVLTVNQWIEAFAREEGILLLDFQPVLSDPKGVRKREFATPDGSHISQKGYETLTLYVKSQIKNDLK